MAKNEAKVLAKRLFWASEGMNDPSKYGMEKEEYREEYQRLSVEIVQKGYSANLILGYIEEYKELLIGEHEAWINS